MTYIQPADVRSPKAHWQLIEVLLDGGPGAGAYALGEWEQERRLAFRWNGTNENPIGNPQSRGLPTWTILEKSTHEAILKLLPPEKQAVTRHFLGIDIIFDLVFPNEQSIIMLDTMSKPLTSAMIPCNALRDSIGQPTITDQNCHLIAECNREVLSAVAQAKFRKKDYRNTDTGIRVIDLGEADLASIAGKISREVLRTAAFYWA